VVVDPGGAGPRPWRDLLAAAGSHLRRGRSHTFAEFVEAVDAAFARWDLAHLHLFALADETEISRLEWWDGQEREGTLEGSKTRLSRLKAGSSSPTSSTSAMNGRTCAPSARSGSTRWRSSVGFRISRSRIGVGVRIPISTDGGGTATMASRPNPSHPPAT
jgi:hypothetical protein